MEALAHWGAVVPKEKKLSFGEYSFVCKYYHHGQLSVFMVGRNVDGC
jgi:hypothetical protein